MPKVRITTDDKTIDVVDDYAMIDMCEDHDTSILFGCRDGACGAWDDLHQPWDDQGDG